MNAGETGTTGKATDSEVDHPLRYNLHPSGVECVDIMEWLPSNLGAAFKYVFRCEHKNTLIQDLEKARWYVIREEDRFEEYETPHTIVPGFVFRLIERVVANEPVLEKAAVLEAIFDLATIDRHYAYTAARINDLIRYYKENPNG